MAAPVRLGNLGLFRNIFRANYTGIARSTLGPELGDVGEILIEESQRSKLNALLIDDGRLQISAFSSKGLRLSNGSRIMGPCVIFPKTLFGWNVSRPEDITINSLKMFVDLCPKLDMLVLGLGDDKEVIDPKVREFILENKIGFEAANTAIACALFNFLNAEGRGVAGIFLPIRNVESENLKLPKMDEDVIDKKLQALDETGILTSDSSSDHEMLTSKVGHLSLAEKRNASLKRLEMLKRLESKAKREQIIFEHEEGKEQKEQTVDTKRDKNVKADQEMTYGTHKLSDIGRNVHQNRFDLHYKTKKTPGKGK